MPDDSLRPTQGNQPEQRDDTAPGWWGELGRMDLPDDSGRPNPWLDLAIPEPELPLAPAVLWRTWLANVLVLTIGTLAALLVKHALAPDNATLTWLIICCPLSLVILSGLAIARHSHRR